MNQLNFKKFTKSAAFVTVLSAASPAMAFFDGELSAGKRSGSYKSDGSSAKTLESSSIQLAVHLDPIPLIPVSFGARFISEAYDAKVADHGVKSMTSTAIVPEVTAWIPFGDLRPFGRVGYTAVSAYKGTVETTVAGTTLSGDVAYKSSGPRLAVGVEWKLIPLVSLTGAYEYSAETITIKSGTIGSVDLTEGAKDINYTSGAILVGVKAGL